MMPRKNPNRLARHTRLLCWGLSGVALTLILSAGPPALARQGKDSPPAGQTAPVAVSLDDALGSVVIGDFQGLIDHVGAISTQIAPTLSADAIRANGTMLGDPGFSAFAKGSGIAVVVFPPMEVLVVAEATGPNAAAYASQLQMQGNSVRQDEKGIVAAQDAASLERLAAVVPEVRSRLLSSGGPSLDAHVKLARVTGMLAPRADLLFQSLGAMMGAALPPEQAKTMAMMLEAEVRALIGLTSQVENLDLRLDFDAQGILVTKSVQPAAGTALAKAIAGCGKPYPLAELARLPGSGGVRGGLHCPVSVWLPFFESMVSDLQGVMKLDAPIIDAYTELLRKSAVAYGDDMSFDLFPAQGPVLSGAMLVRTPDSAKAIDYLAWMPKAFSEGPLADFYKSVGQSLNFQFERDVRKHGATPVHALTMRMDFSGPLAEAGTHVPAHLKSVRYEIATPGDGQLVYATAPEALDAILDGTATGKPLAATNLGAEGIAYFDMHVASILRLAAEFGSAGMPPQAKGMFDMVSQMLQNTSPITMAVFREGTGARSQVRIPADLIAGLARMAMMSAPPGQAPGGGR